MIEVFLNFLSDFCSLSRVNPESRFRAIDSARACDVRGKR